MPSINQWTSDWAQSKNIPCHFSPETTSTNDIAKIEFPKTNEASALFLTDHQTKGRGRFDRSWENTPKGATLLSTWCFQVKAPLQPIFTPLLGLALFQGLRFHFPELQESIWVKPPNDIYIGEGKLCGLLVESSITGDKQEVFIGLGMNVFDKPQVDIPTTCLKDFSDFEKEKWFSFCQSFYDAVEESIHWGQQSQLPEVKRLQLLKALNNFSQIYSEVLPAGGLMKDKTLISWQDL